MYRVNKHLKYVYEKHYTQILTQVKSLVLLIYVAEQTKLNEENE